MPTYIDPASKLFAHTDRLAELKTRGRTRAPINIEIDLSNRCSLGCEWCHFAYTHTRGPLTGKRAKPAGATPGGDLMRTDLAFSIIDQFDAASVRSVVWTGGGEPTLHPDFDAIIEHTASRTLEQGIYTHGGHVSEDRAQLMKRAMSWVYVSLDAADAADYSRDKGVPEMRFQRACDGIRRLSEADGAATIGVGFLLTAANWSRHLEMVGLGKSLGADYVQFRPTILFDEANPGKRDEDAAWMLEALPYLEPLERMDGVEIDLARFRNYLAWDGHGYSTCYWSALQTVVTPNGKVWRCVNKREYPGEEVGDLSEESFADLWAREGAPCEVNAACRLMCRGHLANQALNGIYAERAHEAFV